MSEVHLEFGRTRNRAHEYCVIRHIPEWTSKLDQTLIYKQSCKTNAYTVVSPIKRWLLMDSVNAVFHSLDTTSPALKAMYSALYIEPG